MSEEPVPEEKPVEVAPPIKEPRDNSAKRVPSGKKTPPRQARRRPEAVQEMAKRQESSNDYDIKKIPQIPQNLTGRLALSKQSSRFELPMDMRNLETMTPQEYLTKYCIISSRRLGLYQKVFSKYKDAKQTALSYKDLDKALKDVLINTITQEQVDQIFEMVGLDENSKVEPKLFAGIAAFAERVLYPKYITEDTADIPDRQKERIECADFGALNYKFKGVNVNPPVEKILRNL